MPVREAFRSFFLIDTLKTAFTMRNSSHRRIKQEYFFKNQSIFFSFVFKKTGGSPPSYLHSIVTQEITYHPLIIVYKTLVLVSFNKNTLFLVLNQISVFNQNPSIFKK